MGILDFFSSVGLGWNHLVLLVIAVLSLVEITPIKINPWSRLAKWLGGLLNAQSVAKIDEINNIICSLDKKIDGVIDDVNGLGQEIQDLRVELKENEEKEDEREVINARIRILEFCDELQEGRKHSKDRYDQVLQDITLYNSYCSVHPDFKNNQTEATVKYIEREYNDHLARHDFLSF